MPTGIYKHKSHPHSLERKRKMSEAKKGSKHPFFGKHRSEKTRMKISRTLKGSNLSEQRKNNIRKGMIKFMSSGKLKTKDTKIELAIEKELQRRNIYYQKQVPLCKVTVVDFYLPQTRTVIYCDGDYWHSIKKVKERDINQDVILTFNGFNVYRFTETGINKSAKRCINRILQ